VFSLAKIHSIALVFIKINDLSNNNYFLVNGEMKNFRFAAGPGAYREDNFDELYKVKD